MLHNLKLGVCRFLENNGIEEIDCDKLQRLFQIPNIAMEEIVQIYIACDKDEMVTKTCILEDLNLIQTEIPKGPMTSQPPVMGKTFQRPRTREIHRPSHTEMSGIRHEEIAPSEAKEIYHPLNTEENRSAPTEFYRFRSNNPFAQREIYRPSPAETYHSSLANAYRPSPSEVYHSRPNEIYRPTPPYEKGGIPEHGPEIKSASSPASNFEQGVVYRPNFREVPEFNSLPVISRLPSKQESLQTTSEESEAYPTAQSIRSRIGPSVQFPREENDANSPTITPPTLAPRFRAQRYRRP